MLHGTRVPCNIFFFFFKFFAYNLINDFLKIEFKIGAYG